MLITKVEVTYEDNSTFIVHSKLAPDAQGISVEDLQPVPEAAPVTEPIAEPVVEAPVEVPVTE